MVRWWKRGYQESLERRRMYQSQMLADKEGKVGKSEGGEAKSSWDVERLNATSEKSVLIALAIICKVGKNIWKLCHISGLLLVFTIWPVD